MRERRQIGLATASPWIAFAAEITQGLRSAASRCGMDLLIAINQMDGVRTLANVDELLAAKVDLLIEINQDARLGGAISEKCRKAGTPLIADAFPLPGATNFGVDVNRAGRDGGRALACEVAARWRGEIDLVVLLNVPDAGYIQRARLMGMLEGLRESIPAPPDRIVALTARREGDEGRRAIETAVEGARGRRIVILATNDTQAMMAVAAAARFDRDREILILSQGGVAPARQELRRRGSALWGTIAHFPETFGDRVLPAALQILAGEKVRSNHILRHAVLTARSLTEHYPVVLN
jgi:ABC-type sugar transport system substrate-binding protein